MPDSVTPQDFPPASSIRPNPDYVPGYIEQPATWTYAIDATGNSVASYPGQIASGVKGFGATGNGVTDDTAAIQRAVNQGGVIRFPAGRYLISAPIVSPTSGPMTVIGDGANASVIVQATAGADGWTHASSQSFQMFGISLLCNGVGGCALRLNFLAASVSLLTLRDVEIVGNGNQTTNFWHDGIIANAASVTTIDHVHIAGSNQGPLAGTGNGVYFTPPLAPAPDAGSYVFMIHNSGISYYQNAVVLDSTGHTNNLQGVVLSWVNSNYCMQFVRVLGTCLELVITACQYEGFGSAVHADGASTVLVRDSLFFFMPPGSIGIAAQLPQDAIYANNGGDWWIKDNRFVLQPSATIGYFFNFVGSFNTAKLRDNITYTQSGTAAGLINIANGANFIEESGTFTEFWGSWPKLTNGNAQGGTGNVISLGALASDAAPTASVWQQQGAYAGWNYASSGEMDLLSSYGLASGGFNFYKVASSPGSTPAQLAKLDGNGNFTANGIIGTPIGATSPAAGAFTTLTATGMDNTVIGGTTPAAATFTTAKVTPNGVDFGTQVGANIADLAHHITLHDAGYGIAVTGNSLNYVVPTSSQHTFVVNGVQVGSIAGNASTGIVTGAPGAPNIRSGTGAASGTQPAGSLWLRTDGSSGARLYVSAGGGTWTAVASV